MTDGTLALDSGLGLRPPRNDESGLPRSVELGGGDIVDLEKRKLGEQFFFTHPRAEIAKQMLHREPMSANDRLAAENGGVRNNARE